MKLLISGGTGFVGRCLIERLYREYELVCLIADPAKAKFHPNVEWVIQDLDSPFKESNLPNDVNVIIHLAQSRHYRNFPDRAWDIFNVNIQSTMALLEYGRKIGIDKFIYASSGGIYGYSYEKFIETDTTNPINFYLTTKYCSELLIGNYNSYFNTVVFRFFFVYGQGQQGMLIPRLANNIRMGDPIILYGKQGVKINPIHIDEAIQVFRPAFEQSITGIFNVAGDEIISIKELSELIGEAVGRDPKFIYETDPVSGDIIGDNSRMKSMLGIVPRISVKAGIPEVVQWLKENSW
jgi:UDP-glucose 4-epimerase